jgi:hypothetical protein
MKRYAIAVTMMFAIPAVARSEERFITIQKVEGNRITFVESPAGGGMRGGGGMQGGGRRQIQGDAQNGAAPGAQGGRGMRGRGFGQGGGMGRGRRRGGANTAQTRTAIIPADAKITAAMRERRTFEFRVGIELAGGMRHPVFSQMQKPLSARFVTQGNRITELNVITDDTDVNQRNTSSSGQTVIAVKPKRPPSK